MAATSSSTALPFVRDTFWRTLWVRTALLGLVVVVAYFAAFEIVEHTLLASSSPARIHALHIARGVAAAILLATWAFFRIRRVHLSAEDEMRLYLARLEAQIRHQEKMASLGTLAAGFAHDLGNPLASLATELELLEGERDPAVLRESLDVLRRHVDRMSRTLREMVDFARRRRDELTDIEIASAVTDSTRLVRYDPRWKSVKLSVDVPADLPRVSMVEDHLDFVLINLMLNAADAMPKGGELAVSARRAGDRVEIHVKDSGHGMAPDVLAKAKQPLFTTKGAGHGTGLGLSVSEGIVRAAGGTLDIASQAGRGTDVTIRLPIASEAAHG